MSDIHDNIEVNEETVEEKISTRRSLFGLGFISSALGFVQACSSDSKETSFRGAQRVEDDAINDVEAPTAVDVTGDSKQGVTKAEEINFLPCEIDKVKVSDPSVPGIVADSNVEMALYGRTQKAMMVLKVPSALILHNKGTLSRISLADNNGKQFVLRVLGEADWKNDGKTELNLIVFKNLKVTYGNDLYIDFEYEGAEAPGNAPIGQVFNRQKLKIAGEDVLDKKTYDGKAVKSIIDSGLDSTDFAAMARADFQVNKSTFRPSQAYQFLDDQGNLRDLKTAVASTEILAASKLIGFTITDLLGNPFPVETGKTASGDSFKDILNHPTFICYKQPAADRDYYIRTIISVG